MIVKSYSDMNDCYISSTSRVILALDVPKWFLLWHRNTPESFAPTELVLSINFCSYSKSLLLQLLCVWGGGLTCKVAS